MFICCTKRLYVGTQTQIEYVGIKCNGREYLARESRRGTDHTFLKGEKWTAINITSKQSINMRI